MTFPTALRELPVSVQPTFELLTEMDQCFLVGFANLERSHWQTLESLQRVLSGTPLHQPLSDTCAALARNEFVEPHFAIVAVVRASLQGALFDALQQQAKAVLGRVNAAEAPAESTALSHPTVVSPLLEGVRHGLLEMALTGFARLGASTLVPFLTTLEKLQEDPQFIRLAALLTGFGNELMRSVPIQDSHTTPLYRWVDLWTRSLIDTLHPSALENVSNVSGTFEIMGLDLRQHENLASIILYGLLSVDLQLQFARLSLSAYKVDAIDKDELWLLFPHAEMLLDAFAQTKTLQLTDIPLLPLGDLRWTGEGVVGDKYNLMQRAAGCFAVNAAKAPMSCSVHPCDRHPIQLAEPIFLEGYRVEQQEAALMLCWGETDKLPVALERLSSGSEVNPAAIARSTQLFGLLRFDAGQWAVQPLALTVKGKPVFTGQTAIKTLKNPPKNSTVSILQERASRLLRKR
jgi:hypothetical protein